MVALLALNELAASTGEDAAVLLTTILGAAQGATDARTNTTSGIIALDVGSDKNRDQILNTLGHELNHGEGSTSEVASNLMGWATNLLAEVNTDANRAEVDKIRGGLVNAPTADNAAVLAQDTNQLLDAVLDNPTSFDYKNYQGLGAAQKAFFDFIKTPEVQRALGGALGSGASIGSIADIVKPEFREGLKVLMQSNDKMLLLKLGMAATVDERQENYAMFDQLGDEFGKGMVIGRSTADVVMLLEGIAAVPKLVAGAAQVLKSTGTVTVNGVTFVYNAGKTAILNVNSANHIKDLASIAKTSNETLAKGGKLIGDQPYIAPTNTTGNFQTHGITVQQVPKPIRDQMLKDLQAGGAKEPGKLLAQIIESGDTVPSPSKVTANTPLYKLVDANGDYPTPSPTTPYWVTQQQLDLIVAHPELTNRILALPEANQAHTFNVFKIVPKAGANPTIWQSQTATSTNPSGLVDVGKSVQTIVPDRSLWTTPNSTGVQIKVK